MLHLKPEMIEGINRMTTDTPRTTALIYPNGAMSIEILEHARTLERELIASQAEVEFWKAKAYEAETSEGKHEAEVERLTDHLKIKNNKIKALELSLKTFSNWSVTIKQNLLCDPDFIKITKEVLNEDHENEEKLDILREKIK